MATVNSPSDVVNLALVRIGHPMRVGNLYDGSKAAKVALDIYGQTRDELLRAGQWGFAERNAVINSIKQAPPGGYIPPTVWTTAYPPIPWLFEYAYPIDCLKVRAVKQVPLFVPSFAPQPNVFSTPNDSALSAKVIVCNVGPSAALVYTGRVTDPTQWEASFIEAMAAALARRLSVALSPEGLKDLQPEAQDEVAETMSAGEIQG